MDFHRSCATILLLSSCVSREPVMYQAKKQKELLMMSLHSALSGELKRAISILEYPAPMPGFDEARAYIHVRTSDKDGKSISKFYWRNRLVLTMNNPKFVAGGKILEVTFVRFLECRRIVSTKFEYLVGQNRVRKSISYDCSSPVRIA